MGVRAAERPAPAHQRAAAPALHPQQSQRGPGQRPQQPLPGPLPQPAGARAGAGGGPYRAAADSDRLRAEDLRLLGPEDLQKVPVERDGRIEQVFEMQRVHIEDGDKQLS